MKKYLQNTLALLIVVLVIVTTTACSSTQPKSESSGEAPAPSAQTSAQGVTDGQKQPDAAKISTTAQAGKQTDNKELDTLRLYLVNGQRTYYLSVPAYWSGRVEISEDGKSLSVKHRTGQATAKAKNPLLFSIVKYGSTAKWNEDSKTTSAPFPYQKLGTIGDTVYAVQTPLNIPYDQSSPQDLREYQKISETLNSALATFTPLSGSGKQKFSGLWKITGTRGDIQGENRETALMFLGKNLYYHDEFAILDDELSLPDNTYQHLADRVYYKTEKINAGEFNARYGIALAQTGITAQHAELVTLYYDSGFRDMVKTPLNSFIISDPNHLLLIFDKVVFTLERADKVANPYEVAGLKNPVAFRQFFLRLQSQVEANDKAAVAKACQYPITVNINDKPESFKNCEELLRRYDQIFPPAVKQAVTAQKPDDLFVNYQGVMVGNGQLWLTGKEKGGFAILAVNP